jgi:hypothetical protein
MASFGVYNKSGSIQKFESANIKYRDNAITGFRTMIRSRTDGGSFSTYQPFQSISPLFYQDGSGESDYSSAMYMGLNELEIEDMPYGSKTPIPDDLDKRLIDTTYPNECALLHTDG